MFSFLKLRYGPDKDFYRAVYDIFGFVPGNIELYKLALIHRSASHKLSDGITLNNERLEFLGDAILEAVVSDYLYIAFPDKKEGELTRMRSKVVNRATLNGLCVELGLSDHIILNKGIGFQQKHVFGDALEAIIGAIYLDKGFNFVSDLLTNSILPDHIDMDQLLFNETDFKSRLIEWCQKSKHSIVFETTQEKNGSGNNAEFRSVAFIDGMDVGYGTGSSKKEAEQMAAFTVSSAIAEATGDDAVEAPKKKSRKKPKPDEQ